MQRIQYVDLFRSVGIILMVMGHVGFGNIFDKFIHSFHMPMFFFISGYMFRKNKYPLKNYFLKKVKSLLIPYIFWGLISFVAWTAFKGFEPKYLRILFWDNTSGIAISGALWFLSALFISDFVFFLIQRIENKYINVLIIACIAIIGTVLSLVHKIKFPFALLQAFIGIGFMGIGFYLKIKNEKNSFLSNVRTPPLIVLSIVGIIASMYNSEVNMRCSNYGNGLLFWISATIWSFIILIVSMKFENINFPLKNKFLIIGEDSISFVCLNQIVIYAIGFIFNKVYFPISLLYLKNIIFFVCTMALIYILNTFFMSSPIKHLFGK